VELVVQLVLLRADRRPILIIIKDPTLSIKVPHRVPTRIGGTLAVEVLRLTSRRPSVELGAVNLPRISTAIVHTRIYPIWQLWDPLWV